MALSRPKWTSDDVALMILVSDEGLDPGVKITG
ncbi:MAG: hypothetical protein ACJA1E_001329 [Paracoccaceae bacterium]|jgi:hypothetical protein